MQESHMTIINILPQKDKAHCKGFSTFGNDHKRKGTPHKWV